MTHEQQLLTELAAMHNRAYGFVYLVDEHGKIRWRYVHVFVPFIATYMAIHEFLILSAHGKPQGNELNAMVEAAKAIAAK